MFDLTLQTIRASVIVLETHLELHFMVGLQLGPEQVLPIGIVRVPLARGISLDLAKQLAEAAEGLPEEVQEESEEPNSGIILPDANTTAAVRAGEAEQASKDGSE